jgi:DNA-damage-inducible protein J
MLRCAQGEADPARLQSRMWLHQKILFIINMLCTLYSLRLITNVATMCSMKQSVVRARIDNDLKAEASSVLESCGLGLSEAVRLFLAQVVKQGGLPFPVRARHVVSGDQLWKMKRASQQRDRKLAVSEDVSAGEMLLISPDRMRNAQIAWPVIE